MIRLEVFTVPGCSKCGQAKERLRAVALQIGAGRIQWREVNVLEEMDYAVCLGVLSTPALAIEGELVCTSLPSQKKLRTWLEKRLGQT